MVSPDEKNQTTSSRIIFEQVNRYIKSKQRDKFIPSEIWLRCAGWIFNVEEYLLRLGMAILENINVSKRRTRSTCQNFLSERPLMILIRIPTFYWFICHGQFYGTGVVQNNENVLLLRPLDFVRCISTLTWNEYSHVLNSSLLHIGHEDFSDVEERTWSEWTWRYD